MEFISYQRPRVARHTPIRSDIMKRIGYARHVRRYIKSCACVAKAYGVITHARAHKHPSCARILYQNMRACRVHSCYIRYCQVAIKIHIPRCPLVAVEMVVADYRDLRVSNI